MQDSTMQAPVQGVDKFRRYGVPLLAVLETVLSKGKSPGTVAFTAEKGFQDADSARALAEEKKAAAEQQAIRDAMERKFKEDELAWRKKSALDAQDESMQQYLDKQNAAAKEFEYKKQQDDILNKIAWAKIKDNGNTPQLVDGMTPYQAAQIALGKERINATKNKPDKDVAIKTAQEILDRANKITSDEGAFKSAVGGLKGPGSLFGVLPEPKGGTPSYGVASNIESLKSLMTLGNLGLMKGTLSNADIEILTKAATNINRKLSEKDFLDELNKIKGKMQAVIAANSQDQQATDVDEFDALWGAE